MGILQVSVFIENQPGHLNRLTGLLEKSKVSIRGFSLADTADFGIARFILDKPLEAQEALREAGFLTKTTQLLCIELPDKPGALDHVFTVVAQAGISVEYAYSLISTYVALKVDDITHAQELLCEQPVRLVEQSELERSFESTNL